MVIDHWEKMENFNHLKIILKLFLQQVDYRM